MPSLVQRTAQRFEVREVQGDKAYLSHANLEAIEAVGAVPYIPFKANSTAHGSIGGIDSEAWRKMWLTYQLRRDEVLCKVLCYNLAVVTRSIYELGIETGFGAIDHAAE